MASGTSRIWFIAPAAVLLLIVLTWWSAKSQTAVTNAFHGKQNALVTLRVVGADPQKTGEQIVERMAVMGVDAQVVEARGETLKVVVRRVAEPGTALRDVITPEPLLFFELPEPQALGGEAADGGAASVPLVTGTSRQEVLDKVAAMRLPEGTRTVLECMNPRERGAPTLCAAWRLGAQLPVTTAQLTDIVVSADKRTEEPLVSLTFSDEGARALEAFSTAHAGRMLAVVALGELQARPHLVEPIHGGVLAFSTRTADTDRTESVARAQRIDATLDLPRLPEVTVQNVEVTR